MKILFKKIMGMLLVALFVLSFFACGDGTKSSKYRFNANNGFYGEGEYLYWINDEKVSCMYLVDGDVDIFSDISSSIHKKDILGLNDQFTLYVKNGGKFSLLDAETGNPDEILSSPFEIPQDKYKAILSTAARSIVLYNDRMSFYDYSDEGWKYVKDISLSKDYDSMFVIGDLLELNTIGLIQGKEIDFISIQTIRSPSYVPTVIRHISLDKQYDAYVGCEFAYEDEFVREDETEYLGCIEGKKIKFYDIKRGQFATVPIKGGEISWTF